MWYREWILCIIIWYWSINEAVKKQSWIDLLLLYRRNTAHGKVRIPIPLLSGFFLCQWWWWCGDRSCRRSRSARIGNKTAFHNQSYLQYDFYIQPSIHPHTYHHVHMKMVFLVSVFVVVTDDGDGIWIDSKCVTYPLPPSHHMMIMVMWDAIDKWKKSSILQRQ